MEVILPLTVSETLGRKKPICLTNETDCTPTFEGVLMHKSRFTRYNPPSLR